MATTETSLISSAQPEQAPSVIRRGGLCDLEAVAPLSAALHQECQHEQTAPSQVLGGLRHEALAWGGRLLVAQAGERIVGYCAYNMRQARLQEIFVLPEYRGQRIGRDLLAFVERDLEHANVLSLQVPVEFAGESARAFFAQQGFCAAPHDEQRLGWQKDL
jgi:GNAT superfamily N-acetyltransferase